ncbi:MAG: TRAP transporter small permease subunit [Alphaproteobacteria bacterium]|jgi:TRAP-type mannitol/chloroaromatic compound transport system permease small subunit|nr:TRAP transporter small permease subunit [Alphaproteobacteria bacterium]
MTTDSSLRMVDGAEAPIAIRISLLLRRFINFVGTWASFFIIPLVFVTIFDVTARKLVWIQIFLVEHVSRYFESTLLQEMEWHFHTALFALVLGFGTIYNRHVRVDLVREKLQFRKQAWIEFIGTTIGMLPYTAIVIFFAYEFAVESWETNEISASQVGLSHRWIIKTVLVVGLFIGLLSGIAVWLQTMMVLFGPKDLRFQLMTLEWPELVDERRIKVAQDEEDERRRVQKEKDDAEQARTDRLAVEQAEAERRDGG